MIVFKRLISALTLLALLSCAPPIAEGVGNWDGRNHTISAEVMPTTGFFDVIYIVKIDRETVINERITRSEQVATTSGPQFAATGTFQGAEIRAVHEQRHTLGQVFFRNKIYVDGELVAVITP